MNLLITDICNKECPYCFAQDKVAIGEQVKGVVRNNITLENVDKYLNFLEKSNDPNFKILGGEPTTHPQYNDIVQMGLDRGFNVITFTNGIWANKVLKYLADNDSPALSFVVNINEPQLQTARENRKQEESLAVMGNRGLISFNIYRPGFDMTFVGDLIDRFELKRELRLGLAHPIVGVDVDYPSNKELKTIGEQLVQQMRLLEKRDILGLFDCGFPVCMFEEADLGYLFSCSKSGFKSECNFIVDVGVNLDVWPCFPLSSVHNTKMNDFESRDAILSYYQKTLKPMRSMGSLDYCQDCKYHKRGQCCGGCTGRTIIDWQSRGDPNILNKLQNKSDAVQILEIKEPGASCC